MVQTPVGLTPVALLPSNSGRMTFTIRNSSPAAEKIFFWLKDPTGLSTTNAEYVLDPGEEKSFIYFFDGEDVKQPISAISDGAAGAVYIAETSQRGAPMWYQGK